MGPEVVNKNGKSNFYGDYVGRDNITVNVTLFQESEREFVVTHNANIKPVVYFTGRETELQELRQRIGAGSKSVLVSGMGGIGKTHICRKLFEEYLNKHANNENVPFQYIGFIAYDGDMGGSLQNCLKFKKQNDPAQNREAAWKELEYLASGGKLLLFVDNVDKTIGEDSGLQRLKGIPGAVVLTSRQASFSDEFEPYPIGFLNMEQCKEIYEIIRFRGSGRKINPEEMEDLEYIIENLAGRHTITVELLAHLARTKLWTVKRLREELEQNGFRLTFRKDGKLVNIQESYEVLYDLSTLTEAEQNILEAFSVFPYIPLAAETCKEWLLADAGASEDDDILMGLYQKGWLQFDADQEGYAMHPVFVQFIYDKCKFNAEKHTGLIKACRNCLEIPDSGSLLECQKFIPFGENILEKMDVERYLKSVGFMYTLAGLLNYLGQYNKVEKLYNRILEIIKKRFGEDHPIMVFGYNNLAMEYQRQGEYKRAEVLCKKSVGICERVLGENHEETVNSYNCLSMVYVSQGEYEKAEELYIKSLNIRKKTLGENHADTASNYSYLAMVCKHQGEYEKAEELYIKSLNIRKIVLGENHADTAFSYNCLAMVYECQGKYEKAEELYEKSLDITERMLGENHPETATCYNNLGKLYSIQGKYGEAEELFEKSLRITERMLGENHPETAMCYNNLGELYSIQGKYERALAYSLKASKIVVLELRLNHSYTQHILYNLVKTYEECYPEGNFEQWLEGQMKE